MKPAKRDVDLIKRLGATGLTCDSRAVQPGMIFAALPGTIADGRDYIPQAIEKGAVAILTLPDTETGDTALIADENPRLRYGQLARAFYPKQPQTLVAMTGTNGKSSTVEFLRQIWANAGYNAACFGTLGVMSDKGYAPMTHTTPDAVALHKTLHNLAEQGVTHVAMEASSHGLVQYRLDAVDIAASGFSNLTQDHFDYHTDEADYFEAKARLFTELTPQQAPVVLTVDDEYGRELVTRAEKRGQAVTSIGWAGADIRIDELMPHAASQDMTLVIDGKRHQVNLPLAGEFQSLNAVAALGLALQTGVSLDDGLKGLEALTGVAGRLERAGQTQHGAPVFIDFAHTEDGLNKLLRSVRPHTRGKIVIVFGCGGDRDPDKRPKMGAVAAKYADHVIVTDDNPRTEDAEAIRRAVMVGCPKAENIGDRETAIRAGIEKLSADDCLVIAGKGHESGQIIGTRVIPFSDVEVAREILAEVSK
ncbi:UDP-N-acetylmuramoylalanyl-D-glutamate--2,6-diaminopimelate ligase [Litorimonas taeanensis]|uniref:UDP-N-acetylmuramoyl-L-alanyl-D-glutamate--2,6-diaminopimelate ligase n=1 Tax=Litorimonas taeanensis TaxID=568099 RepID=A0A420WL19_9PROT|nr:UDP-N-acetylmuramoyl-L-alanyl-D-glutamate--2,6-diaminopimelate ligase [Litorimonas taeanensis]RKQ71718.1 UDP-N-acetylmuramoylalanyl-D-glutamate--2,6-diaminopimelate ligase [Litorimonas taeanensis]